MEQQVAGDPHTKNADQDMKKEISARIKELGKDGNRIFSQLLVGNHINMIGMSKEQGKIIIKGLDAALDAQTAEKE